MNTLLADCATDIAELQTHPLDVLEQAQNAAVVILNNNQPTAYLLSAQLYETLLEQLDDQFLAQLIKQREAEKPQATQVSLDEL